MPDKEAFYSNLNMEDVTDVDYRNRKRVFEYLINKNLGDYHDLYVQSDTFGLQTFLKILETCVLKYMNLILLIFYLHLDYHGQLVVRKQRLNLNF